MGDDFGADRVSGQACGHARFIRRSQRRRSDRDRCGGEHQSHRSLSRNRHDRTVALFAGILRSRNAGRPAMRVCMCTESIVLLTVDPALPIGEVTSYRGSEVLARCDHRHGISLDGGSRGSSARHPSSGPGVQVDFTAACEPRLPDCKRPLSVRVSDAGPA